MKNLLIILVAAFALSACSDSTDTVVEVTANSPEHVSKVLDAALRQFRATKVCYDPRNNWILGYWPKYEPIEDEADENPYVGWNILDSWKTFDLSNGTYIIQDSTDGPKRYTPDIRGLTCKTKPMVSDERYKYIDTSEHAIGG